jgi:hypothetical protein
VNQTNCEDAMLQMIAELDGEETEISAEQAAAHLVFCGNCRQEFEQTQNTLNLLRTQKRREQEAELWLEIENLLDARAESAPNRTWQPFLFLGAFLVAYKLLEMLPERELGWSLKFAPLILIVALFAFLKENPFKINTELTLER